jgi:hypothetical protein
MAELQDTRMRSSTAPLHPDAILRQVMSRYGLPLTTRPCARRRPDFARLRRGQPSVFFTPRSGAPKRSDGGLVLEIPDIWALKLPAQNCCGKIGLFQGAKVH